VTWVVFRAMALGFVRDRAALAMSVVLPVAVFLVFAAIFAGASGEQLRLTVAVADEQQSDESGRLLRALARDSALTVTGPVSAAEVRDRVRRGAADAGLVIRADARPVADLTGEGPAPVAIVADPVRAVAARVLAGQVQAAYFSALPDVALRSVADLLGQGFVEYTDEQQDQLDERFAELRDEVAADSGAGAEGPFDGLTARETASGPGLARSHVAYYAGAVALLFLLFSAVHGALSVLEERDAGLLDRQLAGPGGMGAVVGGKFLFLTVQGVAQVTVIFAVAWALHGVPLPSRFGGFVLVTAAAAVAAAGLALVVTLACGTRRQAQTLSSIAILIVSAVGGAMVPRFLMPPWLQQLGWLTPTTWGVEAYSALFWRDEPVTAVLLPVALLAGSGLAALAAARLLARRFERI
jgi:ABC-2 type transport system permease protein